MSVSSLLSRESMINPPLVQTPAKLRGLYLPCRYKAMYGGRGSGKSRGACDALITKTMESSKRVVCCREVQKTIKESVKKLLEDSIRRLGLMQYYYITDYQIRSRINDSEFIFIGLSHNPESTVKSLEGCDIAFVEEAQTVSQTSLDILIPTIRKPGSEIWFVWNPRNIADPVQQLFLSSKGAPPNCWLQRVNWRDNPWFFETALNEERLWCKKNDPDKYLNIWEGEPIGDNQQFAVLPYSWLLKCVGAHKTLDWDCGGIHHAGLDVADDGNDMNAYARRTSSLLHGVETWRSEYLWQTAKKADMRNQQHSVMRCFYDAGGLGAGIKSEVSKLENEYTRYRPFLFGGSVEGADNPYTKGITNGDFFAKLNAQAWWNLRLRAENTLRLLDGQPVDLDRCFFISSDNMSEIEQNQLLIELSQCVYDDSTGKIKVDKAPDNKPSPNMADAVVMAFAYDLRKGLKSN